MLTANVIELDHELIIGLPRTRPLISDLAVGTVRQRNAFQEELGNWTEFVYRNLIPAEFRARHRVDQLHRLIGM